MYECRSWRLAPLVLIWAACSEDAADGHLHETPPPSFGGEAGLPGASADAGQEVIGGWSEFPPASGALQVYVSSTQGSDANEGLSASSPKRSFEAGYELLRDRRGDQLLLKRGDRFEVHSLQWTMSGAGPDRAAVLGAYGEGPRPIIDSGNHSALHLTPGYRSAETLRHVAVVGIHFHASSRDPGAAGFQLEQVRSATAISLLGTETTADLMAEDILIEDCLIQHYSVGVALMASETNPQGARNVRVRRSVIADTYEVGGHASGIFLHRLHGVRIEENVVDRTNRPPLPGVRPSSLDHSIYVQVTNSDVVVRDNFLTRAFDGGMMRPGGRFDGNVIVDVEVGHHQGFVYGGATPVSGGVRAEVEGNLVMGIRNDGVGVVLGNLREGRMSDNLIFAGAASGVGLRLLPEAGQLGNVGVHDLVLENNAVVAGVGLAVSPGSLASNVTVRGNQYHVGAAVVQHPGVDPERFAYQNNHYFSQAPADRWFDVGSESVALETWAILSGETGAERAAPAIAPSAVPDLVDYQRSVGGEATEEAFFRTLRQRGRDHWPRAYSTRAVLDHFRAQLAR